MPVIHSDYSTFPRDDREILGIEEYIANPNLPGIAMAGNIVYAEHDLKQLHLQVLYPIYQKYAEGERQTWPVLVHIHGSAWRKQDQYRRIPALCKLAEKGYVIAQVEYRTSAEAPFPAQIRDTKTAIRWIRQHIQDYGGNPEKIAVMGDSSGGHTALMAYYTENISLFDDKIYPGVSDHTLGCLAWYAPSDITTMEDAPTCMNHSAADSPEGTLMGGRALAEIPEEEIRNVKVITWAEQRKTTGKVLLVHGDKDDTVPFDQSAKLYQKLSDGNPNVAFIRVKNAGHGGVEFWTDELIERYHRFFSEVFEAKGE